jgi:hypothetical protein
LLIWKVSFLLWLILPELMLNYNVKFFILNSGHVINRISVEPIKYCECKRFRVKIIYPFILLNWL